MPDKLVAEMVNMVEIIGATQTKDQRDLLHKTMGLFLLTKALLGQAITGYEEGCFQNRSQVLSLHARMDHLENWMHHFT